MSLLSPADRDPARTDAQAKTRFLKVLNRSLSAVSQGPIWRVAPLDDGTFNAFTVPLAIRLRTVENQPLFLRSTIRFTYVDHPRYADERKVSTQLYAHTVGLSDVLKPELYSWEWAFAEPTYPHLHVRRSDVNYHGLGKLHIPTGRVFFESVLLFLISEHHVQPCKTNWQDILGNSLRLVSAYSTWGGGEP